jgi:hypothetical protein
LKTGSAQNGLTVEALDSAVHIFICSHQARDKRCGHCGPRLLVRLFADHFHFTQGAYFEITFRTILRTKSKPEIWETKSRWARFDRQISDLLPIETNNISAGKYRHRTLEATNMLETSLVRQ